MTRRYLKYPFRFDNADDPRHGTSTGYVYGCRCDRCRGAMRRGNPQPRQSYDQDRAERMLRAYVHDDMTLEQISHIHGVTRERVRQILAKHDPTLVKLVLRRRKARGRLRRYVDQGSSPVRRECAVCGETFTATILRPDRLPQTCGPVHRKVLNLLRYQVDDARHTMQKRAIADWVLANPDNDAVDDRRLRHAQRVLDGTTRSHGRWLVRGSLAYHWATRAYTLGWPIFDNLHPDVQNQIREDVDA